MCSPLWSLASRDTETRSSGAEIALPEPRAGGALSLETTLCRRRSVRDWAPGPLDLGEVAQLLWAAQGITDAEGGRTVPSAGALYPLETSLLAGEVTDLGAGIYRYRPAAHALVRVADGDHRAALAAAALGQSWMRRAPVAIVIAGVVERTARKYGRRGRRYVLIEVGSAVQSIHLEAAALGLGTVVVGAFDDRAVQEVARLSEDEEPFAIMPVGKRSEAPRS